MPHHQGLTPSLSIQHSYPQVDEMLVQYIVAAAVFALGAISAPMDPSPVHSLVNTATPTIEVGEEAPFRNGLGLEDATAISARARHNATAMRSLVRGHVTESSSLFVGLDAGPSREEDEKENAQGEGVRHQHAAAC